MTPSDQAGPGPADAGGPMMPDAPAIPPAAPPANPPPAPSAPQTDRRTLDRALVKGAAWTGIARWGSQVLSWGATFIIARLLTKGDYGLLSMANLYVGFVQLVNEFGVGAAIIRRRDLTHDEISELGGVSLAFGFFLWAVSAVLAIPFGLFFGEPAVRWLVTALGVTFVTTALRTLPRALLTRELRFRTVALIDSAEAVVAAVVTLVLAWQGWSYWSLALGSIVASLAATLLALRIRPHPIRWPRHWGGLREHLAFGGHIVGARMAWYGYSNADMTIVGRVLGKDPLGAYSLGWTMASIPVGRIAGLMGQVTPAIFSAVQHDQAGLRRYFLLVTEGLSFLTFPVAAGLGLVASDLVLLALGDQWHASILPLQILAAYGGFRSITTIFPYVLQAVGRSAQAMKFNLLALAVLPPLFFLGTRWGTTGVALAWVVGYPLVMIPNYRAVFEVTGLNLRGYLRAVWPALTATAVMAGVVVLFRLALPDDLPRLVRLFATVAVGALSYAAMAGVVFRQRLLTAITLFRGRRTA